jgi:hypothetical protein
VSTESLDKESENQVVATTPIYRAMWFKWVLSLVLVAAVVGFGFVRFTEYFAGNLLKSQVASHTNGEYRIEYDQLTINWTTTQIALFDFDYKKDNDSDTSDNEVLFGAESALIQLDNIIDIYFEKSLHIRKISVQSPELYISQVKAPLKKSSFSLETGNLYKIVQGFVKSFQVDDFELNNLHLTLLKDYDEIHRELVVNDLSFKISNFHLDSAVIESNDEILFSESVEVIIKNQDLNVNDGIHSVHFDSLKLSTLTNNFEVFSLKFDTVPGAKAKIETGDFNQYMLNVPYTGIKGVDFLKAYRENILHIDSIIFETPELETYLQSYKRKERNIQVDTSVNNRIVAVLLGVFDKIELSQFNINNAKLLADFAHKEAASIDGLNIEFTNYILDSSGLESTSYYPHFEGMKLEIEHPEFDLPNGNRLNASVLNFSTYDSSLVIKNVLLGVQKAKEKHATEIKIDEIEITGIKPKQIIKDKIVLLRNLNIKHPQLQIFTDGNQKRNLTEELSKFIQKSITKYRIQQVSISNGEAEVLASKNKKSPHKVGEFNIVLNDFTISEKSIKRDQFLFSKNAKLDFDNVEIYVPDLQHYVSAKKLYLNSRNGEVLANTLNVRPSIKDSSLLKMIATIELSQFSASGFDFQKIKSIDKINLTKLILMNANAEINLLSKDTASNDGSPGQNSLLAKLESIDLNNVDVSNVNVLIQSNGVSIAKFSKGYLNSDRISAHQGKLKKGKLMFLTDSVSYGLERFFAPLGKQNHGITVQRIHRKSDSSLIINGFSIRPIPGRVISDSAMKIISFVPEIQISDFHLLENRLTDSLIIGNVELTKPMLRLRLPSSDSLNKKEFNLSSKLPIGFLNDEINSLGLKGLIITNGNITVNKGDLKLGVHELNIDSKNWVISDSTEWSPTKFLWADEFNINLQKLDYSIPGFKNCHHLDSLNYRYLDNELNINGIYFNNWDVTGVKNTTALSFYLPNIKISKPDIYQYLTDSNLVIDKIEMHHGKLEADIFGSNKKGAKFSLPTQISADIKAFGQLDIHEIMLDDMDIQMRIHSDDNVAPLEMDQFSLKIDSFSIQPGQVVDSNKLFWSENIALNVQNIYTTLDKGLYELGADEFSFSTKNDTLGVKGVTFVPTVSRYEYALHKGVRKDVFNISLAEFGISKLDYFELAYNKGVRGNMIKLEDPSMAVLKDKRMPEGPYKRKEILPEMFKRLPVAITFDSVLVNNMKIRYEEFPEMGRKPGNIMLTDMDIKALNVTNDTTELEKDSTLQIIMESKLLDTADLALYLEYDMLSPINSFKMSSTLGAIDATILNRYIEPVLAAQINSGNVYRMDMSVIGNDSLAGGKMGLYYDDLKFTLLNQETHENTGFGNWMKNKVGNSIVKTKNKYHPFKRRSSLYFERITGKGWINYLIKIELAGIASSVGIKHYDKELKQANKVVWKEFDKNDKATRKAKAKAEKKAKKKKSTATD